MDQRVIIVDDDRDFLEIMGKRIRELGFDNILLKDDPALAAELFASNPPCDLALIDMTMPGMNGLELLDQIKKVSPATECIMITAVNEARTAVECLRKGAYDYLIKPVAQEDLALSVHRALEHRRLIHILDIEKGKTPLGLKHKSAFKGIDTRSPIVKRILKEAELHAGSDVPVLITGESGTGKEVLAQAIHKASPRAANPFTPINMASLNGSLFDAEFFGHTRGAFTGAEKARSGYLEKTHQGTLFLDEIGHLPLDVQGKLLRFMQDGSYYRVGASTHRQADIRLVAATNADLDKLMAKDLFRKDLYYRIRGGWLHLPPLRERKEDIPLLADYFMKKFNKEMKKDVKGFSTPALQKFLRHSWPGNVRELENCVEYAVAMSNNNVIDGNLILHTKNVEEGELKPLKAAKDEFERDYVSNLLTLSEGNVSKAARLGGKYRADFYGLLKKHNLKVSDFKKS